LAEESQRSSQIIENRFPERTGDFRKYVQEHPEMPRDLLYDKKDKSRLDYYMQGIKDPIPELF